MGSENKISAVNEKESINKVLKSNPSDSSIDKTKQILTKKTKRNTEEKENMESTTKETYTRSQHRAMDKITATEYKTSDVQKERNSKMILDQMSRNEVLVNIGTESKNDYKMCAEDEMTKSVTVQEDKPMIAHLLDLTNVWLDKYKYNDAENQ